MRENRTYGSEGGEPSNGSLPYPYHQRREFHQRRVFLEWKCLESPHSSKAMLSPMEEMRRERHPMH